MGIRSILSKPFAAIVAHQQKSWAANPVVTQQKVFSSIIEKARPTIFGKDHNFEGIKSHSDYKDRVPVRDYEGLSSYVKMILDGKENVLWPGKPFYLAKLLGQLLEQNIFQ